ncbi:MAG: hypothetical protein M1151_06200 [Candidatus Thermoplasmatota archaeon]|nr:hypothetical protein [Candidatus Thermoplasmatota archaeon]
MSGQGLVNLGREQNELIDVPAIGSMLSANPFSGQFIRSSGKSGSTR